MFCSGCQKEISDDFEKCPHCGLVFAKVDETPTEESPVESPAEDTAKTETIDETPTEESGNDADVNTQEKPAEE